MQARRPWSLVSIEPPLALKANSALCFARRSVSSRVLREGKPARLFGFSLTVASVASVTGRGGAACQAL